MQHKYFELYTWVQVYNIGGSPDYGAESVLFGTKFPQAIYRVDSDKG